MNRDCVNCDKGECCEEWKRGKFWDHLITDNSSFFGVGARTVLCWRPVGCALVWLEKESTDEHT